jgi:hypothetical protein
VCSAEALTEKIDPGAAWLMLDGGERLELEAGETVLGRLDPMEEVNPNLDLGVYRGFELGVSRRHAVIHREDDHYIVEDLGSTNGTFVNRDKVEPGNRSPLNSGDTLFFGRMKAVFNQPSLEGDVS